MARHDNIGLFWQDIQEKGKRNKVARIMPDIPDTGWEAPKDYPNLKNAKALSIDTETYDPELNEHGPGWARDKDKFHIVGFSVATEDNHKWYFPIRHSIEKHTNMDVENTLSWARDNLCNPSQPKIGANIVYDIGAFRAEDVLIQGDLYCTQYAEALIDSNAFVALDVLAKKYLGEGKDSNLLYQWCSDYYGGDATGGQRKNIHRAPPSLVGPYGEADAALPMRIMSEQYPLLAKEGLLDLFRMECDLIYLMIDMRYAGVHVDLDRAEQLREELIRREKEAQKQIKNLVGFDVNVSANESLAKAFDKLSYPYIKTPKGNPSFVKEWLAAQTHDLGTLINETRLVKKMRGTFVEGYILNSHVNEMVYGQFHQLKAVTDGDSKGAKTGRFSSSTPNLQNIPIRDEILGPMIRGMFIPDTGHIAWRKYDYSQIEYRILAHYAVGSKSDWLRETYRNNPNTDYHNTTHDLILEETAQDLQRRSVKTINFALLYGMGIVVLCKRLGISPSEGKHMFAAYHKGAPYVKATMDYYMDEVQRTGVITTILGRKTRFDLWEPKAYSKGHTPLPYELALNLWGGRIKRAYSYKAINYLLQGSAADVMKKAMWKCYKDGIFDRTGVPRLTVHDELDFSDIGGCDEAFREMVHVMESALKLNVPIICDGEIGPNWGDLKDIPRVA